MPKISEFFGIIISMYWFDTQKHKQPHFHARFQGSEAVFDLSGKCLAGDLGARAARLISEWCDERKQELEKAWACAVAGKEIPWVLPIH